MNSKLKNFLAATALVFLTVGTVARAQQPAATPSPKKSPEASKENEVTEAGEDAGNYTVVSSIEVGYRGLRVNGDLNKYQSDLNYKAGPRIFDSSFMLKSRDGKGKLFDSLLVTSSGWGADPNGQLRFSVENPKWYRFDGGYRRFKYFRFLNSFANPNWVFNPATFSRPPNPVTGEHGTDTRMQLGDFDLTLLPKDERIRFNFGYSPERLRGPAFISYRGGGNEFNMLSQVKSRANDFRLGADGRLGPIDFSFLQGFRFFRDDTSIHLGPTPGTNANPTAARLTSFDREEPARGEVNFTRFSIHSLVAKKLDITGRLIHSNSTSRFIWAERFTGVNWNPRVTGWPPTPPAGTPNTLNLGTYNVAGTTTRPSTLGDIGLTLMATDKFRISNTFRVEDFEIDGSALFNDFFSITRGSGATLRTDTVGFSNLDARRITKYRKYQNTIETDYQFNPRYSIHFGYRYGSRHLEESFNGFNFGSNGSLTPPAVRTSDLLVEDNRTNAFFGGFRARPASNWTVYFDAERGTADNVFTRIGNYDYTNIRAKSRYAPSKNLSFNLAFITKNNSNPSEIAGVSLQDFGVDVKSRIFSSSVDWAATSNVSFSTGYNFHWISNDAVLEYFFNSVRHPLGRSQYFMRNHFFFIDSIARLHPRVSLYAAYRINKDTGQGDRIDDPTGTPGTFVTSYPMSFQTPEARLTFKLHKRLDWNVGYQYYNYNESVVVGPRPQNYRAHLPYTSLRVYFGRRE